MVRVEENLFKIKSRNRVQQKKKIFYSNHILNSCGLYPLNTDITFYKRRLNFLIPIFYQKKRTIFKQFVIIRKFVQCSWFRIRI